MRICTVCSEKTSRVCRPCGARWCSSCGEIERCPNCHPQAALTVAPTSAVVAVAPELPAALVADVAHMAALSERDVADSTRDQYERAWSRFVAWCADGYSVALPSMPAPPAVVATYVGVLEQRRVAWSTIGVALAAIAWEHGRNGHRAPTSGPLLQRVRKATRRSLGTKARAPRRALTVPELRALLETCDASSAAGSRDRALLLLGFVGAFRKSELIGIDVGQLEHVGADLVVALERSKTDQEGEGRHIGIPLGQAHDFCAVRAVRAWRRFAVLEAGPLFRPIGRYGDIRARRLAGRDVGKILKRRAALADLDGIARLGAHSLRVGFITEATRAGMKIEHIAKHVGHSRLESTRGYVRKLEAVGADNPARVLLGLSV